MEQNNQLKLKTNGVDIKKGNPFANDKLDRKKCADVLTGLIDNYEGSLVISINGSWGTGKTTFLKMWEQDLQDKKYVTIFFNAWNEDYCNDALVALIGQLSQSLKSVKPDTQGKAQKILTSIKKLSGRFLKNSVPVALRLATAGLIELKNEDLEKCLQENLGEVVSSVAQETIKEYEESRSKLSEFKEKLSEFAATVTEEKKPLVVIIDELDRCRPLFAIEVLEKAKHLFDIPGVVFVLGIDREQLGHSVRSVYGEGMNVNGYLRRFIDVEFLLPISKTKIFCTHLFDIYGLKSYFQNRYSTSKGHLSEEDAFETTFTELCECFNLSLRDTENCVRLLVIACKNTPENYYLIPHLLSVLIVLKLINPKLYHQYVSGVCNSEDIIKYILEQPKGKEFLGANRGVRIEASLFVASNEKWRDLVYSNMGLVWENKSISQPEYLPDRIKMMDRNRLQKLIQTCHAIMDDFNREISRETLGYLTKKIELTSLMLDYRD